VVAVAVASAAYLFATLLATYTLLGHFVRLPWFQTMRRAVRGGHTTSSDRCDRLLLPCMAGRWLLVGGRHFFGCFSCWLSSATAGFVHFLRVQRTDGRGGTPDGHRFLSRRRSGDVTIGIIVQSVELHSRKLYRLLYGRFSRMIRFVGRRSRSIRSGTMTMDDAKGEEVNKRENRSSGSQFSCFGVA